MLCCGRFVLPSEYAKQFGTVAYYLGRPGCSATRCGAPGFRVGVGWFLVCRGRLGDLSFLISRGLTSVRVRVESYKLGGRPVPRLQSRTSLNLRSRPAGSCCVGLSLHRTLLLGRALRRQDDDKISPGISHRSPVLSRHCLLPPLSAWVLPSLILTSRLLVLPAPADKAPLLTTRGASCYGSVSHKFNEKVSH